MSPGSSGPSCQLALHEAGPAPSPLLPQLNQCIIVLRRVKAVCFCSAGEETELYDREQEVGAGARPEGAAIAEADVSGGRGTAEDMFCLSSNWLGAHPSWVGPGAAERRVTEYVEDHSRYRVSSADT